MEKTIGVQVKIVYNLPVNRNLLVIRIFWVPFRREYSNLFIVSYVNNSNILAQAHLYLMKSESSQYDIWQKLIDYYRSVVLLVDSQHMS